MRHIRWRGNYTDLSIAALTNYNGSLQATYGFTAVGTPVRRTFGTDGIFAMAAYQEAVLSILARGGQCWIQGAISKAVDYESLKQFTVSSFGLQNPTIIEDIET